MDEKYKLLTEAEIKYVKRWTDRHDLGEHFTFSGWKKYHTGDQNAPSATKIGGQVVGTLEEFPTDPRLDFIGLTQGLAKGDKMSDKKSDNAQFYKRLK